MRTRAPRSVAMVRTSRAKRVLPMPASAVWMRMSGSPRSMTASRRPVTRPISVSRPMNGAVSPRLARVPGSSSSPRSWNTSTGSRLPLRRTGVRRRQAATCRVAAMVSSPAQMVPTEAASHRRAAVLTVSPMTVYSRLACIPETTRPERRPMRRPMGRPPPDSALSRRRTRFCMTWPARTARSASSSWERGAPKTAMRPSPVSLSTWPPNSLTAPTHSARSRSVTEETRSGSRLSDQVVKSERSPKSTVT